MVYSSMKKLLAKFPYFLKKSSDSNFYKSEAVFNEQFKDLYNDLFQVYESFHLNKRLFVWREQSEPYNYCINFVANYSFLKSVTCYKNDEVIYTEHYNYEDEADSFIYSYEGTVETPSGYHYSEDNKGYIVNNNDEEDIIPYKKLIPEDDFKIIVETWEEYTLTKVFPENDEEIGDIHDHDLSLDNFGILQNISRKNYKTLSDDEIDNMDVKQLITYYTKTEPSFNNKVTEDDYHYMNRILQYLVYFHKLPLPVIEIWKLYGLNPENKEELTFTNREKFLCKMFETARHLDENGDYDETWEPKKWEHKDTLWCPVEPDIFFFANVNNASPVEGMTITFDFDFIDEYGRKTDTNYYIIPYLIKEIDNELVYVKYPVKPLYTGTDGYLWSVETNKLPDIETEYEFDFIFRAYEKSQDMEDENSKYLESDIIKIAIKGCNSADWYVDCVDGSDFNNGKTRETAFRTLTYALKQAHGGENVVALLNKNQNFNIDNVQVIDENCSIISCPAGATIYQNNDWEFFKIMQDCNLYLQNVSLKHKCCTMHSVSTDFIDQNALNYPIHISIPKWLCKISTKIEMTRDYTVYAHHQIRFTGKLLTDAGDYEIGTEYVDGLTRNCPVSKRDSDEPVKGEEIDLYLGNQYLFTNTTGNDGSYNFNYDFDNIGTFNLFAKHEESKIYCNSENNYRVTVNAMPTDLSITKPATKMHIEDSFTVPYSVKDYYDVAVTIGKIKLYEDNILVKTVNNGETLTYKPTTAGAHNYRVEWSHDNTYISSNSTFNVDVVKYQTNLFLIGEGKSVYTVNENIGFTGILTDEDDNKLSNMPVKVYDGTNLLTTLTTNNNGEISYSGKLTVGNHSLHLEYAGTSKYNNAISNNYRVRVRDSELPDIQLYLYPEHKILGSKATSIPVHVYACNKRGEPLSTTFKIWNTYDNACETNTSTTYTTGNDGWWSGNISTQAIKNCEGTFLQAISTLDEDVYSKVSHIRYTVEPELEVIPELLVDKSVYSYNNEVIHVFGGLVDEEEDPVPNENLIVKVYADDREVKRFNLTTGLRGEFEATYTTNSSVRGKDLIFELTYNKHNNAYKACSDEVTVLFKQLATSINAGNINLPTSQKINITGSVIDENNIPADAGSVTITFDSNTYNVNLVEGNFSLTVDKLLTPADYPVAISYAENTYYKVSNKSVTCTVTKLTPIINIENSHLVIENETSIIPYTFNLPNISPHTTSNIPVNGTVSLKKTNNTEIVSVNVNEDLEVLFDTGGEIACKLVYSGNNYINSVTITGITITVVEPSYIITDKENGPWDVNLVDEFPANISGYGEEDYLIRTEYLEDGNPKLTITDDPDYDDSNDDEEDIILIDTDVYPDIVIKDDED